MAKTVLHKQLYKRNAFGGETNTTLCRRVRNEQDYNVADSDAEVTCKFCRRILERGR
jgi:hypothetical protein